MTKFATALTALTLAAGLTACGSSGGQSSASTQQSTTAASQPPGRTSPQSKPLRQQLASRAQRLLGQLASDTGSLASGGSATQQRARARLAQLQSAARSLAQSASQTLAPSNPIRPLIVQAAQHAAGAAESLRQMKLTASTRHGLRDMQSTLSSLSASLGQISASRPSSGTTTVTNDLQALQRLLTPRSNPAGSGS